MQVDRGQLPHWAVVSEVMDMKVNRTVFATEKQGFCSVNIVHGYAVEALRKGRNKSQVMHHGLSRKLDPGRLHFKAKGDAHVVVLLGASFRIKFGMCSHVCQAWGWREDAKPICI